MKNLILLALFLGVPSVQAESLDFEDELLKIIYGIDNRRSLDELDVELDRQTIELGRPIFAQIPNWRIDFSSKDVLQVKTRDLLSALNICPEEKFVGLPLVASCTAFLVGPDLIMTAGHCIKDKYDCKKQTWVLDYDDQAGFTGPEGTAVFSREKSFQCAELVSWSNNDKLDYSLVRLDRKVMDRAPLNIRRNAKTQMQADLLVIGHPLGLPKVFTDNVSVRENGLTYTFKTNADTFSGNSGSPVIDIDSGMVEGMLIRGDDDFEMREDLFCQQSKRCRDKECRGETVLRSTVFPLKNIPKI